MPALVFVGFVVLQMTISNVVYPILQGKQLSLSPLAIIVAMTFWSWVWGIAGALIAVPLTAAVVIICGQFDRSRWIARLLSALGKIRGRRGRNEGDEGLRRTPASARASRDSHPR